MWTSFWLGVKLVGTGKAGAGAGAGAEAGSHVTDAHAQELVRGKGTGIGLQDQKVGNRAYCKITPELMRHGPHLSFASVMLT